MKLIFDRQTEESRGEVGSRLKHSVLTSRSENGLPLHQIEKMAILDPESYSKLKKLLSTEWRQNSANDQP